MKKKLTILTIVLVALLGLSFVEIKNTQTVQAASVNTTAKKYGLTKHFTFPKRFRGTWYGGYSWKAKISAHKMNLPNKDRSFLKKATLFKSSESLNERSAYRWNSKPYRKFNYKIVGVWRVNANMIRLAALGQMEADGFTYSHSHGHPVLIMNVRGAKHPNVKFFKSRSLAKKYY